MSDTYYIFKDYLVASIDGSLKTFNCTERVFVDAGFPFLGDMARELTNGKIEFIPLSEEEAFVWITKH